MNSGKGCVDCVYLLLARSQLIHCRERDTGGYIYLDNDVIWAPYMETSGIKCHKEAKFWKCAIARYNVFREKFQTCAEIEKHSKENLYNQKRLAETQQYCEQAACRESLIQLLHKTTVGVSVCVAFD